MCCFPLLWCHCSKPVGIEITFTMFSYQQSEFNSVWRLRFQTQHKTRALLIRCNPCTPVRLTALDYLNSRFLNALERCNHMFSAKSSKSTGTISKQKHPLPNRAHYENRKLLSFFLLFCIYFCCTPKTIHRFQFLKWFALTDSFVQYSVY